MVEVFQRKYTTPSEAATRKILNFMDETRIFFSQNCAIFSKDF